MKFVTTAKTRRISKPVGLALAIFGGISSTSAIAAIPASACLSISYGNGDIQLQKLDYRSYYHCHNKWGEQQKLCHGGWDRRPYHHHGPGWQGWGWGPHALHPGPGKGDQPGPGKGRYTGHGNGINPGPGKGLHPGPAGRWWDVPLEDNAPSRSGGLIY